MSKSGAKFAIEKLEFLNSMHIREKFDYVQGNETEAKDCVNKWRELLKEEMPKAI